MIAGCSPGRISPLYLTSPMKNRLRRRWEGASAEGNASAGFASAEGSRLGTGVPSPEVTHQFVDAGDFEITAEDQPYPLGFLLDHSELAILQLITEREGATHP
jgi:hypothetical protein